MCSSHVEHEIEARIEGRRGLRCPHCQLPSEQAVAPVGGLVGKIELGGEDRALRSLHFNVIVTGAPRIKRGQDSVEAVATLTIGKECPR